MDKNTLIKYFAGFAAITAISVITFSSFSNLHELREEDEDEGEIKKLLVLDEEQRKNAAIAFTEVREGEIAIPLPISGKVQFNPNRFAHVTARSDGIVNSAKKNLGDKVKAGEVLAVLESKDLAETKASYFEAKNNEILAKTRYDKDAALYQMSIGSELELLQAKTEYDKAVLSAELAKEKLLASGVSKEQLNAEDDALRLLEIRAPFDSSVIVRHLAVGEAINAGDEIFQLADLDTVWVELGVPFKDAAKLQPGQTILLRDGNGKATEGKIQYVSPVVEAESGKVMATAVLDNRSGAWRPGSYVYADLIVSQVKKDLIVPLSAVVTIEDEPYVFIETEAGIEVRPVEIDCQDRNACAIRSGVVAGEKVVSDNASMLKFEVTKRDAD